MKTARHKQSKNLVDLNDLFKCLKEVETVDFVIGINADCDEVVKISIENLSEQIEALQA